MNTCIIDIDGKEYTFCLTRETIKWLESQGMNYSELDKKMVTYVDLFWLAGLMTKHGDLSHKEAMELLDKYSTEENGDVMEVVSFLIDEYTNFVYALTDTSSKKKKAKIVRA